MKKILCFGDSNAYGYNPSNGGRYSFDKRWSGILSELLKDKAILKEAGCNNRTAFSNAPDGIKQTGYKILPKYLKEDNYDIVILSIGINDLQKFYNPTLKEFKTGIENLIKSTKQISPNVKILLICPSKLDKIGIFSGYFKLMFDENSIKKSENLSEIYTTIANEQNCQFLDLNDIAKVSEIDGLHFGIPEHNKIAQAVYTKLQCFLTKTSQ